MLSDLRAFILTDPTISGIVGTRFYPEKMPSERVEHEAMTYSIVGESTFNSHSDSADLNRDTVQLDIYARKASEAYALKDALKSFLNSASGTQGSTTFGYIDWEQVFSNYEDQDEIYRITVRISVLWYPTP